MLDLGEQNVGEGPVVPVAVAAVSATEVSRKGIDDGLAGGDKVFVCRGRPPFVVVAEREDEPECGDAGTLTVSGIEAGQRDFTGLGVVAQAIPPEADRYDSPAGGKTRV